MKILLKCFFCVADFMIIVVRSLENISDKQHFTNHGTKLGCTEEVKGYASVNASSDRSPPGWEEGGIF